MTELFQTRFMCAKSFNFINGVILEAAIDERNRGFIFVWKCVKKY